MRCNSSNGRKETLWMVRFVCVLREFTLKYFPQKSNCIVLPQVALPVLGRWLALWQWSNCSGQQSLKGTMRIYPTFCSWSTNYSFLCLLALLRQRYSSAAWSDQNQISAQNLMTTLCRTCWLFRCSQRISSSTIQLKLSIYGIKAQGGPTLCDDPDDSTDDSCSDAES